MRFHGQVLIFFCALVFVISEKEEGQDLPQKLLKMIANSLNGDGENEKNEIRQYRPQNNGISANVYSSLQTIIRNDELECVPRLLCEATAGGNPGFSRQINIDKQSLTALVNFLQIGSGSSSPLLSFGKAALLGMSNRGDAYSCYSNYPKCPRDQERLLHYLNNHRGGFFRFFDMKIPPEGQYQRPQRPQRPPVNYHYPNQQQNGLYSQYPQQNGLHYYYPQQNGLYSQYPQQNGLHYNVYLKKQKPHRNQLHPYRKTGNGGTEELYAKKYDHSSMSFSPAAYQKYSRGVKNLISFPADRRSIEESQGRIQTKIIRPLPEDELFTFSNSHRFSKSQNQNFFPSGQKVASAPVGLVTDRLPNMFYFPQGDFQRKGKQMKFPTEHSGNSLVFRDF